MLLIDTVLIILLGLQQSLGLWFPKVTLVNRINKKYVSMSTISPISPKQIQNALPVHQKLVPNLTKLEFIDINYYNFNSY